MPLVEAATCEERLKAVFWEAKDHSWSGRDKHLLEPPKLLQPSRMKFVAFGFVTLCSVAVVAAALVDKLDLPGNPGKAPEFKQMDSFDNEKASGKWYGHYYLNNGMPSLPIHCWSFIGTPKEGGAIEAQVTTYVLNAKIEKTITVEPIEKETSKFDMKELSNKMATTTMVILGTDYDDYLVKVDVFEFDEINRNAYSINVYSRTPEMSDATLDKVKALLKENEIPGELEFVRQDCPKSTFLDKLKNIFE